MNVPLPVKALKAQCAGETLARQAAERRAEEALVRADRAEHALRNLTRELQRARRHVEWLSNRLRSEGIEAEPGE